MFKTLILPEIEYQEKEKLSKLSNCHLIQYCFLKKTSTLKVFKTWILPEIEYREKEKLSKLSDCHLIVFKAWMLPVIFKTEYWEKRKEK